MARHLVSVLSLALAVVVMGLTVAYLGVGLVVGVFVLVGATLVGPWSSGSVVIRPFQAHFVRDEGPEPSGCATHGGPTR